jgi:hypothetical protein
MTLAGWKEMGLRSLSARYHEKLRTRLTQSCAHTVADGCLAILRSLPCQI